MYARKHMLWSMLVLALALVAQPLAAAPLQQEEDFEGFAAELLGENEVPGPGDPDGAGGAGVAINEELGVLCFALEVEGITLPAAAAHIHEGAAGVAGPIVVPLEAPDANGVAEGCVEAEGDEQRAILSAIVANPANYYVNVHTSDYPQGALRGQLATAEVPDVELPDTGATDNPMLLVAGAAVLALLAGFGVRRRALA